MPPPFRTGRFTSEVWCGFTGTSILNILSQIIAARYLRRRIIFSPRPIPHIGVSPYRMRCRRHMLHIGEYGERRYLSNGTQASREASSHWPRRLAEATISGLAPRFHAAKIILPSYSFIYDAAARATRDDDYFEYRAVSRCDIFTA